MRKPRLEDFDPQANHRTPEAIDMTGVVPIAPHKEKLIPVFSSPPAQKEPDNTELQASLQANKQVSKQDSLLAILKQFGDLKATNAATFRFPPDVLDKLEETEYLIRKTYKIRATKNALVVGALVFLLWDFEQNGANSVLYRHLASR